MRGQFSSGEESEFDVVETAELRAVLDELHRDLMPELQEDHGHVTLEEIAEATGASPTEVEEAVRRVRRARMAEVLRELEEPTYRVERPGQAPPDPMFAQRFNRDEFPTLLDNHRERTKKAKTSTPKSVHEHVTDHLATFIAVLVAISFIILLVLMLSRLGQ
jgi:DNA-binding transcriptional ArsR family regulator